MASFCCDSLPRSLYTGSVIPINGRTTSFRLCCALTALAAFLAAVSAAAQNGGGDDPPPHPMIFGLGLGDTSGTDGRVVDIRMPFGYTLITPEDDRVLGCVYIRPSTSADADVYMWMRDAVHDAGEGGLTRSLFHAVKRWLEQDWPFTKVSYVRTGYYLAGSG